VRWPSSCWYRRAETAAAGCAAQGCAGRRQRGEKFFARRVDSRLSCTTLEQNRRQWGGGTLQGETTMRCMILVKANHDTENGVMPSEQLLADMGRYNEELVKAGIMLAGEGLHPSARGARVRFDGSQRSVIDGPFAETKELIAGFWLWQVRDLDEAIEWVKRCPNPTGEASEIEIRPLFEAADFGEEFTPELREQEERLRAEIAARQ
jgi:hypothetical protein